MNFLRDTALNSARLLSRSPSLLSRNRAERGEQQQERARESERERGKSEFVADWAYISGRRWNAAGETVAVNWIIRSGQLLRRSFNSSRFPDLNQSQISTTNAKTKIPPEKELFVFILFYGHSGGSRRRAKKPRGGFTHANSSLSSTVG